MPRQGLVSPQRWWKCSGEGEAFMPMFEVLPANLEYGNK